MKIFENTFHSIYLLFHLSYSNVTNSLVKYGIILSILNKAQEVGLIFETNHTTNSEMMYVSPIFSFLNSLIKYGLVIDLQSADSLVIIIVLFFVLQIALLCYFIMFSDPLQIENQLFLHQYILIYPTIIHIPITYSALKMFTHNDEICSESKLSICQSQVPLIAISAINYLISLLIKLMHIYFARTDHLMGDSHILHLSYSFLRNLISEFILALVMILKITQAIEPLRFALIIVKQALILSNYVSKNNCKVYAIIEFVSIISASCLFFVLPLSEYLLIITLSLGFYLQLIEYINNYYLTIFDQNNLITLQKIEQAYSSKSNLKQLITLLAMFKIHNCPTCENFAQMANCIFLRMANQNIEDDKLTVMYCNHILNTKPIPALIRLLSCSPQSLYYRCSVKKIAQQISKKCISLQREVEKKSQSQQLEENSQKLDVQTIYTIWHCTSELFPIITEAITAKIQFWNELIKGFPNISNCLNCALKTTDKMMKCRDKMEEQFDLQQYQLRTSQQREILSMRILQIYYCGVYTNFFHSYQLEKEIIEQIKLLIFRQDEPFSSIKLIEEKIFIFQTSLIKRRGDFLNLNYKRLSNFLNISETEAHIIQHCAQMQPQFISDVHDQLMDNYIQKGYSKLPLQSNQIYLQNLKGYLEPCFINLHNFYNNQSDVLMNLIMSKEKICSETIIFGIDGKILGITEKFYEDAIKQNVLLNSKSQQTVKVEEFTDVKKFIQSQPIIQLYIQNIASQVQNLEIQITNSQNYQVTDLRSFWAIPQNHSHCLKTLRNLLAQYHKEKKDLISNIESQITMRINSKSIQKSFNSFENIDIVQFASEDVVEIDGIQIIMLKNFLINQIQQILEYEDAKQQLEIQYNLQFRMIKTNDLKFGYFVLTINDYNIRKGTSDHFQGASEKLIIDNQQNEQQSLNNEFGSFSEKVDIEIPAPQDVNQTYKNLLENRKNPQQSNIIFNSYEQIDQQKVFLNSNRDSDRQQQFPLIIFSKSDGVQNVTNDIKLYDVTSQKKLEQIEEIDLQLEDENVNSQNQSQLKKPNLLQALTLRTKKQDLKITDFGSNQTRSTAASTIIEATLIVEQIYHKTDLITPLKKITILLVLLSLAILIFQILNVFQIYNQLEYQTSAVMNLIKPQNMIYYYSSVFYQMWSIELDAQQILLLSEFQQFRNKESLLYMINYGRSSMLEYNIDVAITAENLEVHTFNISIYEHQNITIIKQALQDFYLILYQITTKTYYENIQLNQPNYEVLLTKGFCRQNILELLDLHNQLVNQIADVTISSEIGVQQQFQITLLAELFSIIILLGLQLNYWFFIDSIKKQIIALISRSSENQALLQIKKMTSIKQSISGNYKGWQTINFNEIMHDNLESKQKVKDAPQSQTRSQLYFRIIKTQLRSQRNIIITITVLLVLSGYLIAGYFIQQQKNSDFQPSLIATLQYGQFRIKMDSIGLIAGISKTEGLIEGNNLSLINQTYALSLLIDYKSQLLPLINDVADTILKHAVANNVVSRFDNLLHNDLCEQADWSTMKSCDPSQQSLPYSSKDYIRDIVKNGVLGYSASLIKYLEQDFNYELHNLKYNSDDENLLAIQSKSFQNYFLSYYCDLQDTMMAFFYLFQVDNSDIASQIVTSMKNYYLGFGITFLISLILITFSWIYKAQKRITSLRQILILLPTDIIVTSNIKSQAKQILYQLY